MAVWNPQANDIFLKALDMHSPGERRLFLDQASGDNPELRAQVELLLSASERAGSFLEKPAADPVTVDAPPLTEGPGTRIGPYKLLEPIGEGGMGTVWMAEQQEPVRRLVALKVIKAGMDSAQVVARFEAERQALALMDHPHIAKVLDAGTVGSRQSAVGSEETASALPTAACLLPTGDRPFFVMELVKGIPITRYCDEHRLTLRQRLELFIPVCQAIQHAHQKGVIHRDVKPSNVLVAPYDGRPGVKVIDFGVAKATGQRLTERTLFTGFGAVVGTLEYMSPEQAELNNQDIDTRSDLYSLGVLLYELLTGTTPLAKGRLKQAAFTEMLRMIREEEPPEPSTRLSSSDTLPAIAAARQTEPAKLTRLVRGELDWIVMKALEKDRTRRYETANSLARDIERYLADEPVEACPPSAGYRLKKFARKYKKPLAVSAAFVLLLVVGVVASTWQAVRATRAEEKTGRALEQVTQEQQKTEAALTRVTAEQQKTKAALATERAVKKQTVKSLNTLTDDVVERLFAQQPVLGEDEKAFLRKVLGFYDFAHQLGDTVEVRELRAWGYAKVGTLRARLGQYREAAAAACRARDLFAQLAAEFPDVPEFRFSLATSHNSLALALRGLGNYAEAEKACRRALTLLERLVADSPKVPEYRGYLARTYTTLGLLVRDQGKRVGPEIEAGHRRAAKLLEELAGKFPNERLLRHDLAQSHGYLGLLLYEQGKYAEAEPEWKEKLTIMEKLVAETHGAARYRLDLVKAHVNLANLFWHQGRYAEAEPAYRKALALADELAAQFPLVPEYRQALAFCHHELGCWLYEQRVRYGEMESSYRIALEIQKKLVAELPTPTYRAELAGTFQNWGLLLEELKKYGEAEAAYQKALDLLQKLVEEFPDGPEYRRAMAVTYNNLGFLRKKQGRLAETELFLGKALKLLEKVVADFPDVAAYQVTLAASQLNQGNCLREQRKPAEALPWYERALVRLEPMAKRHGPGLVGDDARRFLRNTLWGRAGALDDLKRPAEALNDWARAVELSPPADRLLVLREQAGRHADYGMRLCLEHRPADALAWYDRALAILERLHKQAPKDDRIRRRLRNTHWGRAGALEELKRHEDAQRHWNRALELSLPAERSLVQLGRAKGRVQAGKAAEAVADVEALTKDAATPGITLYNAACICGLAAAAVKEDKQRDAYASQAVALLRRAQSAEFFKDRAKVEHLKKETDLDVLRSREDFKKFVAELEAALKP
jgi:serine/threonine protein kinase